MAEERVINLSKVKVALERIEADPDALKGVNEAFDALFANLGIDLNWEEKSYLICQLTVVGPIGSDRGKWGPDKALPAS
jgi:hypothetical protein